MEQLKERAQKVQLALQELGYTNQVKAARALASSLPGILHDKVEIFPQ